MSDHEAVDAEVLAALHGGGPDPYAALEKVLALPRRAQRSILRLEVWCENSKCSPIRVYDRAEGLLVQCRSDADVRDLPHVGDWSRRRAFFLQEWPTDLPQAQHLQVVCDCLQTEARLVDVRKLAAAMPAPGTKTRRLRLPEVSA